MISCCCSLGGQQFYPQIYRFISLFFSTLLLLSFMTLCFPIIRQNKVNKKYVCVYLYKIMTITSLKILILTYLKYLQVHLEKLASLKGFIILTSFLMLLTYIKQLFINMKLLNHINKFSNYFRACLLKFFIN